MRVTCRAANRTSPWMGLTKPEAFESFSSRFCRTAAAAASSKSLASILFMPSICTHRTLHEFYQAQSTFPCVTAMDFTVPSTQKAHCILSTSKYKQGAQVMGGVCRHGCVRFGRPHHSDERDWIITARTCITNDKESTHEAFPLSDHMNDQFARAT